MWRRFRGRATASLGQCPPRRRSAIVRNGNGNAAGIERAQIPAGAEGALERVEAGPISSWFVAGVVALVVAGMLFGAATVMYLHRGV